MGRRRPSDEEREYRIERSRDDGSGNRTQDQWTTRPRIKPLHHEDKIALSIKFCGFYSACTRRGKFIKVVNFRRLLAPPPFIIIIVRNSRAFFYKHVLVLQ